MRILELVLSLIAIYTCSAQPYDPLSYTERPCGSNLTNLWLDIVAVVDNSVGMGDNGLINIVANLQSIFASGTRIGVDANEPRTTRLGLVTYNSEAIPKADLNKYGSVDDLFNYMPNDIMPLSNSTTSYLATGLTAAEKVLEDGRKDGTNRLNYKQVVLVYASAFTQNGEDDPVQVANRLKTDGARIITVAYNQNGDEALLQELSVIASPRFNFSNALDGNPLIDDIQTALLEANCFCQNDWVQYRDDFHDALSQPYGTCLQPVNLPAIWRSAQSSCRLRSSTSHLASEYSQRKHDFIFEAVKSAPGFSSPYKYHIGLNFNDDGWLWDQPMGWTQPVLQNWTNRLIGYPQKSSQMSGGRNTQNGLITVWQNIPTMSSENGGNTYVCEMYSCDTENYCALNKN